jgi:hypothetical protein
LTTTRIRIVGDEAAELARWAAYVFSLRTSAAGRWESIQTVSHRAHYSCGYGCTLMARKRGCVTQYQLLHSSTYGCALGRNDATREVPVSVAPKATA